MHSGLNSLGNNRRSIFSSVSHPNAPLPEIQQVAQEFVIGATPQPAPADSAQSLRELVLATLASVNPVSQELLDHRTVLISEASVGQISLAAVDEFIEVCERERESELERQYRDVRTAGRKQAEVVEQLNQNLADTELALRNQMAKQEGAFNQLTDLSLKAQRGRHVPRWATDEELAAWDEQMNRAKSAVDEANEAVAMAMQQRNQKMFAIEPAAKELNRLGQIEVRLRKARSGETYYDPEYGLAVRP